MEVPLERYIGGGQQRPVFAPGSSTLVLGIAGNALSLTDAESGTQELLGQTKCKRGINVLVTNGSVFALSYRDASPSVFVFRGKDELVAELKDGAELEYSQLAISRDGKRVAGVSGSLKRELFVWDVESSALIASIPMDTDCEHVTFSPTNNSIICSTGRGGIEFWEVESSLEEVRFKSLSSYSPTRKVGETVESQGLGEHCWTCDGCVIAVMADGGLVKVDPHSAYVLKTVDSVQGAGVLCVAQLSGVLLVGCTDGRIRWLKDASWGEVRYTELGGGGVAALEVSSSYDRVLATSSLGRSVLVDSNPDDTNEPIPFSGGHVGAAYGLAPVFSVRGRPRLVCSVGQDKIYRIWDLGAPSSVPVYECTLSEKLVSVASSPCNPFVAVGMSNGIVETFSHYKSSVMSNGKSKIGTTQGHGIKVCEGPASMLAFDSSGAFLATASPQEALVSVFSVPETGAAPVLSGVLNLKSGLQPSALAWDPLDNALVVAVSSSLTSSSSTTLQQHSAMRVNTSALASVKGEAISLVGEVCGELSKSPAVGGMVVLSAGQLVFQNKNGGADVFDMGGNASLARAKSLQCKAQQGDVWCLSAGTSGDRFATGSFDGAIALWRDGALEQGAAGYNVIPASPASAVCFSADNCLVVSSHLNGSLSVLSCDLCLDESPTLEASSALADPKSIARVVQGQEQRPGNVAEHALWSQRAQDALDQSFERSRDERRTKVALLQQRLLQLLENNEHVPDLEKLDRNEFIVDVVGNEAFSAANIHRAEQFRATIEREIKGRELVMERIKKECWDSQQSPCKHIHGLGKNVSVRNFPVPHQSATEKRQVKRVTQLRSLELRELRRAQDNAKARTWDSGAVRVLPENSDWMVNAGILSPVIGSEKSEKQEEAQQQQEEKVADDSSGGDQGEKQEKEDTAANVKGQEQPQGEDTRKAALELDAGAIPLLELLYHPAALRSGVQMRSQLVLLKQVQREMILAFNKRFELAVEQKEDAIDRISAKHERINEIMEELKLGREPMPEYWRPDENPESVFEASEQEVGFPRYLSRAERDRLAKEEEERLRKEAEAAKDNLGARALDDMMNGTLEAAKELSLAEQVLTRPEWMDEIEYSEMTDEQRREFDEFELALAKFTEEKEKYTKSLEQELKKLHGEVGEVSKLHDDSLDELARIKLDALEAVTVQGLYIARLELALVQREDFQVQSNRIQDQTHSVRGELNHVRGRLDAFNVVFEERKAVLAESVEADKALERAFKGNLSEAAASVTGESLDPDLLRFFQQLFKTRAGKKSALDTNGSFKVTRTGSFSRRRSSLNMSAMPFEQDPVTTNSGTETTSSDENEQGQGKSLDPFARTSSSNSGGGVDPEAKAEARRIALEPLDKERDLPEGSVLDDSLWELLQKLRHEKILQELEVRERADEVATLQEHFDALDQSRRNLERRLTELTELQSEIATAQRESVRDIEVVVRCKQGQDEVKPGAVITDYGTSLLLSRSAIERENTEIQNLGAQKVGVMTKMKDFRKSINYMQWEHQFMLMQEDHLDEHYTDLHMLRVTKSLQSVIKGGESSGALPQDQTQATEGKIARMAKIHQTALAKARQQLCRTQDKEETLVIENEQLVARTADLQANVEMRDAVFAARTGRSLLEAHNEQKQQERDKRQKKRVATKNEKKITPGAAAARSKMKDIVMRRKLTDLVRAQSDEIEFLKHELEILRQKNFPRFANPSAAFAEKKVHHTSD